MRLVQNKRMIFVVLCLLLVLSACSSQRMRKYYSEKTNFISVSGTVYHILYNENNTALYLGFEQMSSQLPDETFKIVGENLEIVQKNGIDDKLSLGDQVTFTTAPRYFGDGYVMPIVAITVDGEVLLEFETGHANFLNWLQQ